MMNHQINHTRPVLFGEVLFDCFPDGSRVLGGAPFNVAWHCQAFGLNPLFISRVGDDALGHEVRSAMHDWGMDTSGLQLDDTYATGVVDISFNNGEPCYKIVENSAWDHIDQRLIAEVDQQCVLYHGSLALRSPVAASSLTELKQRFSSSIFVDINLRPPWWDLSLIKAIIQHSHWVKLNVDELASIVPEEKDTRSRIRYLLSSMNVKLLVITQGDAGAIAATDSEWCSVQPDTISKVVDTVGAGDAFSSVLLLGIHRAWSLQKTLNCAQQFASAVVSQRGATTQNKTFYKPFIKDWGL